MGGQDVLDRFRTGGWKSALALVAILVLAGSFRMPELGRDSIWGDEGVSWMQASAGFADMLRLTAGDNYPPLHNVVLWVTMRLAGDGEAALRLPSALAGMATILAVFALGRELGGTRAGLFAALALAVMPLEIVQSRNARMYTLFSLTATLYLWSAARQADRGSRVNAVLGGLAALAMLYAHTFGSLVFAATVAAMAVATLRARGSRRAGHALWLGGQAVALVLFSPWLFVLAGRARTLAETGFWPKPRDVAWLGETALTLLPAPVLALCGATLAAAAALAAARRDSPAAGAAVVAAAAAGACLLAWLVSIAILPVLVDRYFIFLTPAVLALTGAALAAPRLPRLAPILAGLALTLSTAPQAREAFADPGIHRDYRAAAFRQAQYSFPGETVSVFPGFTVPAFLYYGGGGVSPPRILASSIPGPDSGRIWYVVTSDDPGSLDVLKNLNAKAGRELEHSFAFHRLWLHSFVDAQ